MELILVIITCFIVVSLFGFITSMFIDGEKLLNLSCVGLVAGTAAMFCWVITYAALSQGSSP